MNELLTLDRTVKLNPYIPRDFKPYVLMTDNEIVACKGETLIVDTESYPNFFLICFKHVTSGKIIKFEINGLTGECMDDHKLSWIMHHYITVGFNSIKYDLPLIWYSYSHQHTQLIKALSDEIIFLNAYAKQLEKDHNFQIYTTSHVDLIEVCPLRGSLKLYGARLHAPRIQDLPYDINSNVDEDQIEIITHYCINDLDCTELALNNLLEPLKLRADLSKNYQQDLMSKSDAQIAEAVIATELKRLTGYWPKKPKINSNATFQYKVPEYLKFQTSELNNILKTIADTTIHLMGDGTLSKPAELNNLSVKIGNNHYRLGLGGLHSSEKNMCVKSSDTHILLDRDVASYYPAVILNQRLFPQHLGINFLKVYQGIVDKRLAAKKAKNISISECLKITINGTFGKTGSPYSILYSPDITIQITLTGQLALLMLIEQLELNNIPVVSANTDGVLIYCPRARQAECGHIIEQWEKLTGFITEETIYDAIYSRDVNAYMAVKPNKEVKGKNIYYDPWRGKTAKDTYWKFQKNPNAQICIEAIERLITDNIPIEEVITSDRQLSKFLCVKNVTGGAHKNGDYLGKVVRWYYAKETVGTINYIRTGNKVPDTDGAKPCMDLPQQFPTDINYDWYINKTKEMLTEMRYYKPIEQLRFF